MRAQAFSSGAATLLLVTPALAAPSGSDSAASSAAFPAVATTSEGALAWADFNGDGLPDALLLQSGAAPMLLQNVGDGQFLDRSELLAPAELGETHASAWGDFDGDGLPDLLAVDAAGRARLLHNGGAQAFLDVTAEAGLDALGTVRSAHWNDYDGDALADLVVSGPSGPRLFHNAGGMLVAAQLPSGAYVGAPADAAPSTVVVERAADVAASTSSTSPSSRAAGSGAFAAGDTPPAVGGPSATGTLSGAPAGGPAPTGAACVPSLRDQSSPGSCLAASSDPTLGRLYPITQRLFVSPDGYVGMGTTGPLANLHVRTGTTNGASIDALEADTVVIDDKDAVLGLYSTGAGSWGSGLVFAEVGEDVGTLIDKWSIARLTNSAGSRLRFTYGSDASYATNPTTMTLEPGHVGIGTNDPAFPLHVVNPSGVGMWVKSDNSYSMIATSGGGLAGFFDGSVNVGYLGSFGGLPVPKVEISTAGDVNKYGRVHTNNSAGTHVTTLESDFAGRGRVRVHNFNGTEIGRLGSDSSDSGILHLWNAEGESRIRIEADQGGVGRITTDVLEIMGGADIVESFDTREPDVEPGTVMVIDPDAPGRLCVADEPYDAKVAGVVSGAGGVRAGLSLGQDGVSGDTPVALTGRVYVKASAENGPIRTGDRLTTSATPGHAMRVADTQRSVGAVIGKAMTSLDEGTGLVLVLVNLQ